MVERYTSTDREPWTAEQWVALVGTYMCVETPATAEQQQQLGCGTHVGGAGDVVEVITGLDGIREVVVDYGFAFPLREDTVLYLCRDATHGDHISERPEVRICVARMGERHR